MRFPPKRKSQPQAGPADPPSYVVTSAGEDDSWSIPALYGMAPAADLGTARQTVRQLVDGLAPDAIDAGTGAVLDNTVNAWADQWLARLDTDHTLRENVVAHLVGQAAEKLAAARAAHQDALAELGRTERTLTEVHTRLTSDVPAPGNKS
ncbi:hypothetical protein [Streptacidiphilus carbonis]|uniref:hypothetical protein n=1 Tax=Streptacidiphilus carbonis TaxID=105422 RepID=UPI0005A6D146|nr:hypothetical protein [Streptacidiphilus carbonis]